MRVKSASSSDARKIGPRATRALANAWLELRRLDARIPDAVLLTLDVVGRRRKFGHFAHSTWSVGPGQVHEVAISPALFRNAEAVLATMLHEAAHAILWETDTGGVRRRYYHTKRFRDVCRSLGLGCEFHNTRYGWTVTGWPDGQVPEQYAPILRSLSRALPDGTTPAPIRRLVPGRLPPSGLVRMRCGCQPARAILVPKRSRGGAIHCGVCHRAFAVGPVPDS
jgi:hypothetical protein